MGQMITCTCKGVYYLVRGQQYELIAHDTQKDQVRVRFDDGRIRSFPAYLFDLDGGTVALLESWRFDDPVIDALNGLNETHNWVDIVLHFDDGTYRWCSMVTPGYLKLLLESRPKTYPEPMVYAKNMIVIRDLATQTVEQALRHMDQQDELIAFSNLIRPAEPSESEPPVVG